MLEHLHYQRRLVVAVVAEGQAGPVALAAEAEPGPAAHMTTAEAGSQPIEEDEQRVREVEHSSAVGPA